MRLLPQPPVLLITDRRQASKPLEWVIAAALEGGIRWISLREKDLGADERIELLRRLREIAGAAGALLMVHDDLEAALRLGLGGLHLPASADTARARDALPLALLGQSWHGAPDAGMLNDPALDYLTLSPVFLTESKPGYGPALGPAGIEEATSRTTKPLVALGGVDLRNITLCRNAGATGVAVMGGVMRAADPAAYCAGLVARVSSD